jgi:hypothetical protein
MFDDMYIPWTPRCILRSNPGKPAPVSQSAPQTQTPEVCPRTLHIARALMAHAVEPFPEAARAISAAFAAFIRGALQLNFTPDDPSAWTVLPPNPI